ncbi:hypothetical protein ABGT24_12420 [Peribacillus frigoritolerans]|uniref:hypothetical protein n=1 Tax=Peribacillus frigoritolerans TaxID=450367 RepID=UPI00345C956A
MEDIKQKFLNSEVGVWLSVVSVVFYASYYIYATSFNQYYGLPSNLIELKIENVAVVIAYGLFIISIFFVIPKSYRRACRLIFEKFPSLNTRKKDSIKIIVLLIALYICKILIFPLFGFEITRLILLGMILVLLANNKQSASKWIMMLCIYSVALSIIFGTNSAAEKEDYLIMSSTNNKNYVVIKTFQDKFIIAPVNLKRKEITPKFQFIEIKSDKDNKVEFTLVHTGKLKVKKVMGEQY